VKEKALSRGGLHNLRLKFSPAWLRNFVAACGLARSTAAYGGLRRRLWGLVMLNPTNSVKAKKDKEPRKINGEENKKA